VRNVPKGLKIVDWKPKAESSGLFGWLFQSVTGVLGPPAEKILALFGQISETLKLDGLVSLWHPAST
jgi:protease-4